MALQDALIRLENLGLTDILLPFVLIFTIIYAVSAVVPHFSDEKHKKLRIMIALVISLLVVIPHATGAYPAGLDIVSIINSAIPQVVMLIVAVVLTLMLVAATTGRGRTFDSHMSWIRWVALLVVGLIFLDNINFGYGSGFFGNVPILNWFSDPDLQALVLIIIVFGLIVFYITGDSGSQRRLRPAAQRRQLEAAGFTDDEIKEQIRQR